MGLTNRLGLLEGWTPIRFEWRADGEGVVDWCHTAGVRFDDPFFSQTIDRCLRHPFRLLFRQETGLDELERFAATHAGLPPAGFVFHLSRCGSTLVARMLSAAPAHLVLSEPAPLDSVLRPPAPGLGEARRIEHVRSMVAALGQRRDPEQRRLFVKFDAWSVLQLPLVRRAFPDVPWLFLYRDPVEVLASHARIRGAHVIPGALPPELFGLAPTDGGRLPIVEYGARALAAICTAALAHRGDPRGTFVNYSQLPESVVDDLVRAWALGLDRATLDRMRAVAAFDAKNPAVPFQDDRDRKQRDASDEIRAASDRWLAPLYVELERARAETRRCAV